MVSIAEVYKWLPEVEESLVFKSYEWSEIVHLLQEEERSYTERGDNPIKLQMLENWGP